MAGVRAKLIGHSTGRYRLTFAGEVTNDGQVSAPTRCRRRRRGRVRACVHSPLSAHTPVAAAAAAVVATAAAYMGDDA